MLCVEDYLDALGWADSIGGLDALIARADANAQLVADWVERTDWVDFLARDPATRSNTSVCLVVVDPDVLALDRGRAGGFREVALRPARGGGRRLRHRRRIATRRRASGSGAARPCEAADLEALLPWLDWAFATAKAGLRKAA